MRRQHSRGRKGLIALAIVKLLHGVIFSAVAIGALNLLHKDVQATVTRWIDNIRIDPDNRYIAWGLEKIGMIDSHELKQLSVLIGVYALLFLVQGVGLAMAKRWAEWLTVAVTGFFIPFEMYELVRQPHWAKILVLTVNVAIVVFLGYVIAERPREG